MTTLAVLSTVPSAATSVDALVTELLGPVDRFHLVDETLLRDAVRAGVDERLVARVVGYVDHAADRGADVVLVTCSSIGGAADAADHAIEVPVRRIDRPMAEEAVAAGGRIGVLATLASTLGPTTDLVMETAAGSGREVTVESLVVDGAFDALRRDDTGTHDRLVTAAARSLAELVDVVVLAQASMARAVPDLDVPVLSSPRSGVQQLAPLLGDVTATRGGTGTATDASERP